MDDSLEINLRTPTLLKNGVLLAFFLSIILFVIYWYSPDPLWANSWRLGAFVCFALAVMGYLKIRNSTLSVIFRSSPENLQVEYQKNHTTINSKKFERSSVKSIKTDIKVKTNIDSYFNSAAKALQIVSEDSSSKNYLLNHSGQPLLFDEQSQKEIQQFLNDHDFTAQLRDGSG